MAGTRYVSMNSSETFPLVRPFRPCGWALLLVLGLTSRLWAASPPPLLLEDYTDTKTNRLGVERLVVDDRGAGSRSTATTQYTNGVVSVRGELVPGRGVPGFISVVSLLRPEGKPQDLSGFTGVRLKVKVLKGILCVQVASTEIQNFDYHTSAPLAGTQGEFREVRVPFRELKRAWSPPSALNLKTITSLNLVSFGMTKDTFSYQVDELGFY